MTKTKIALIGEDPTDTGAITSLMKQKYDLHFKTISRNQRGSKMFNESAVKSYNIELTSSSYKCAIVIIDADAIITETQKLQEKRKKYDDLAKQIQCDSLLLLNIYELEALILSDVGGIKRHYNIDVNFSGSVIHKEKPKEYLKNKTNKKYEESECPKLFNSLSFDTVQKNCSYFKDFVASFEKVINS